MNFLQKLIRKQILKKICSYMELDPTKVKEILVYPEDGLMIMKADGKIGKRPITAADEKECMDKFNFKLSEMKLVFSRNELVLTYPNEKQEIITMKL